MSSFYITIVLILNIIIPYNCSLSDNVREPLLGIKRVQTKGNTKLKLVQPQETYAYPGNNYFAFKKISRDWNNYYACLMSEVQHEKERKPIILQIVAGQFISMKCSHCPRPFEESANLEWRYKPLTSDVDDPVEPEILDLAPRMKLTHKMTLNLYNAIVGYAGLYVCYHGNNPTSLYILEVLEDQPMILLENPNQANDTIETADGTQLQVYYSWSKWTECSACDKIGKKYRYGTCMIKLRDYNYNLPLEYTNASSIVRRDITRMKNKSKKVKKSLVYNHLDSKDPETAKTILNKFLNGIPCTSKLLPEQYGSLIQEQNKTGTAVLVEYCKTDCTKSSTFEVIDTKGNLMEIANNTAGIYSSFQAIPKATPEVERKTVTINFGEDVVIQCPGDLNTNIPVTWMLDKRFLVPELIAEESKGRITVDLLNKLHIRRVRLKDGHIYSCWERDKLAGTVTLNVEKKHFLDYDHHTVLISILGIALTFIYVGIKILSREVKLRKRLTA